MSRAFVIIFTLVFALAPLGVYAAGSHDNDCTECHSLHDTKGEYSFAVPPNTSEKYTGTGAPAGGTDALCLGCHNEDEGIIPIALAKSHPLGLIPVKVNVPQEALGGGGQLTCTSCHDPHPSNAKYMYLRVSTDAGKKMGAFCAYCHGDKVDKNEM